MKSIKKLGVFLGMLFLASISWGQTFSVNNLSISGTMTGPQQAANTVLANISNSTAAASPVSLPASCAGALSYAPLTGFSCVAISTGNLTYTNGTTGASTRTVTAKLSDIANVLDWSGCDPTGVADSTTCIQNAFNAAGNGLVVNIPAGTYNISSTLTIGNGSATAPSTTNGQMIIGLKAGGPWTEVAPVRFPVQFKWTGASGGTMLIVEGPIWSVQLSGISFNANSLANTCVLFNHPMSSHFESLLCTNYKGPAYGHMAYPNPTSVVVGSSDNRFDFIQAKGPAAGGSGIIIGGTDTGTAKHLDVARNVYYNDHFDYDLSTANTYGIALQFVDNVSFIETITSGANSGTNGVGLFVNPPTTGTGSPTQFPGNIQFYNSPIIGNVALPGTPSAWNTPTGIGFWPYPTGDSEVVPTAATPGLVYGITDSGKFFGASGGTPVYSTVTGTLQYNNHTVFSTIQLSGGTYTMTFSGGSAFTSSTSYLCQGTDISGANAVKIQNSSGTATVVTGNSADYIGVTCTGN